MLFAALRDMQWRSRRFFIAVVSTGLVFAMTLVLTGLANGFRVEAQRTVDSMGVDLFVVKSGAPGPFMGSTPFAPVDLSRVAAEPGVVAVAPLACAASTVREGTLQIGARTLRIVGIVPNSTALAKMPNIFLTTEGLQQLAYNGQPMVTSIGIVGTPQQLPSGYQILDRGVAVGDLMRPMKVAVDVITIVAVLLWIVAALIVGSVVYRSALERLRDFAVFKATGAPTRSIMAGLALQAVIVALLAAALGVVFSQLLTPLFPMNVVVPMRAYLALPVIAIVIGLLASGAGLRRAVAVDPALAFGGP